MAQEIDISPKKNGTLFLTAIPTDEDDSELSFAQLTDPEWQMMREIDGVWTVIDGCAFSDSSLESLEWIISGTKLALFGEKDSGIRKITFTATYGENNLPLIAEGEFVIEDIVGIDNEDE